jgi:hypothetical protein
MPPTFCGNLTVSEVTFRLPGHVPLAARFERGSCLDWHRCTIDSGRLPVDAPNAEGRPQWKAGPFRGGCYRHALTLGEALLLAERLGGGVGVDLARLASGTGADDDLPF